MVLAIIRGSQIKMMILCIAIMYYVLFLLYEILRKRPHFAKLSFVNCLFRVIHELTEAAAEGVLLKKVFLRISQISQGNTCVRVSFLLKLQTTSFLQNSGWLLLIWVILVADYESIINKLTNEYIYQSVLTLLRLIFLRVFFTGKGVNLTHPLFIFRNNLIYINITLHDC